MQLADDWGLKEQASSFRESMNDISVLQQSLEYKGKDGEPIHEAQDSDKQT